VGKTKKKLKKNGKKQTFDFQQQKNNLGTGVA
jgi:hypothetical protein